MIKALEGESGSCGWQQIGGLAGAQRRWGGGGQVTLAFLRPKTTPHRMIDSS